MTTDSKSGATVKPSNHRRLRRYLWSAAILVALYTLTGFLIAPAIIKWQLGKQLPGLTHRQTAIRQVKANPYAFSLTIRGLELRETNGEPFAGFDEFYARFSLSSIYRGAWTFGEVRLVHPTATIVRLTNGRFNFSNLTPAPSAAPGAASAQEKQKPSAMPSVLLQELVVSNGDFRFIDNTRAKPLRLTYGPVEFTLRNFTTQKNKDGLYALSVMAAEGGAIAWSGTVSINPLKSAGTFALRDFALKTYSPYLSDFIRADLTGGALDISLDYSFGAVGGPVLVDVTNAAVRLSGFQLNASGNGESLVSLDKLSVRGISASLSDHTVRVPSVVLTGGGIAARRDRDGQLNWLKLLAAQPNAPASAPSFAVVGGSAPTPPVADWKAKLDELTLDGVDITVEDRVPATPVVLRLDNLSVKVKGISNQPRTPVEGHVGFKWHEGGTFAVEARGTLLPPAGQVRVEITNFALRPFDPYIEEQARMTLVSGLLNVSGQAHYEPESQTNSRMGFSGEVSVKDFATIDTVVYHDLLKWDELAFRGIRFGMQPNALSIDEIELGGMEASAVVNSNGQVTVTQLLKQKPVEIQVAATVPAPAKPAAASESFPVLVGMLRFEKCSFVAADQSITPRFGTRLEEFSGTISNLTYPQFSRIAVDLHGRVNTLSVFEVKGTVLPDKKNPYVAMAIQLKNDDLTVFTPYSEKYAGHPLTKGKLNLNLAYRIQNRQLQASNVVMLDQFTFGARNHSTNATKLPVKLAVALLKDRNGQINLDLPVHGSLDDPQFSVAGIIWKTISNVLVKAATSPFSLLGSMFGGGPDLEYAEFAPGTSTLDATQTNKLGILTKALYERPSLNLEMVGSVDPASDRNALAVNKLRERIRLLRVHELEQLGTNEAALARFCIAPADYERLLRKNYEAYKKSTQSATGIDTPVAAAAATSLPAPAQSAIADERSVAGIKGATLLMHRAKAQREVVRKAAAGGKNASIALTGTPEKVGELTVAQMEQELAVTTPASDADLLELASRRATAVERVLQTSGKVSADRIYVVAPKAIGGQTNGVARVTFSLE